MVHRWWAYAVAEANPDPAAEQAWARIKTGDESEVVARWRPHPDGGHDVYHRDAGGHWRFSHHLPLDQA